MKRRVLLVLVFALVLCISVSAASTAYVANPSLSFVGATAYCSVVCMGASTTDYISATLTLYQGSTVIGSWSGSGYFRVPVSGNCNVTSGVSYDLELTWSVNGSQQPGITVTNTCQ